jgi:hypothetical protein
LKDERKKGHQSLLVALFSWPLLKERHIGMVMVRGLEEEQMADTFIGQKKRL